MIAGLSMHLAARFSVVVMLLAALALPGSACSRQERSTSSGVVRVFAAASLTDVIGLLAARHEAATGVRVDVSTASSSTLARQIEEGAKADIFISANPDWMDYLESKDLIAVETRRNLLNNQLVLVASRDFAGEVLLEPSFDFPAAFTGRLALGDPDHVPAGQYSRRALEALGWWEGVKDRLAPATDVSAALAMVETGQTPLGIVYATNARRSGVRLLAAFGEDLTGPIHYPAATLIEASPAAAGFLEFLFSEEAAEVFTSAGYTPVEQR